MIWLVAMCWAVLGLTVVAVVVVDSKVSGLREKMAELRSNLDETADRLLIEMKSRKRLEGRIVVLEKTKAEKLTPSALHGCHDYEWVDQDTFGREYPRPGV